MHRGAHGDAPQALALAEFGVEPFGELVGTERGADAADVVHSDVGHGLRELFRFDHRDDVHRECAEGREPAQRSTVSTRVLSNFTRLDGASMIQPRGQLRAARADAYAQFRGRWQGCRGDRAEHGAAGCVDARNMPRGESVLRRDKRNIMAG